MVEQIMAHAAQPQVAHVGHGPEAVEVPESIFECACAHAGRLAQIHQRDRRAQVCVDELTGADDGEMTLQTRALWIGSRPSVTKHRGGGSQMIAQAAQCVSRHR
jgi:hypothetical protein